MAASSARAALTFQRPDAVGPDRDQIAAAGAPEASTPDTEQIAAARALAHEHETSVAPRVGESRQPVEARLPIGCLATPSRPLAAGDSPERLASRSGCAQIARWCLAHATSTQAP